MADLNACARQGLSAHESWMHGQCRSHKAACFAQKNSISSHQSSTSVMHNTYTIHSYIRLIMWHQK